MSKKKIIIVVAMVFCTVAAIIWALKHNVRYNKDELEFESVNDVLVNAQTCAGKKYQNLTLPEKIAIPPADRVYSITSVSKGNTDPKDGLKQLCRALCVTEPSDIIVENGLAKADVKGKYMVQYSSSNAFMYATYASDPSKQWAEYDTDTVEAVYDLDKDDISAVSYDFSGKQYAAADAVEFVKKEVKEKLSKFFKSDTDTKAKELIVFNSENRGHYYYITFEHCIDGVPLLRSGTGDTSITRVFPSRFDVHIHDPNVMTVVSNYAYTEVIEKRPLDSIMTLQAALKNIEKQLAPQKMYIIKDVRLVYATVDTVIGGSDTKEYHPTWCFIINEQPRGIKSIDPKEILLCDAITGDVSLWSDRDMDYVFGSPKPTAIKNDELFTKQLSDEIKRKYVLTDEQFNELIMKDN